MMNFPTIWQYRSEGIPVRPTVLIYAAGLDIWTLAENAFEAIKISGIIKKIFYEMGQVERWYQIPLKLATSSHPYECNKKIIAMCASALGILSMWPFISYAGRSLAYSIIPSFVQKPIDADVKLKFIQKAEKLIYRWNRDLVNRNELSSIKQEVSSLCGE
ncbi:MAG: hypothetical protein ACRDF4_11065, partial [Rhabdochlamydiaceae bacterium]